MSRAELAMDRKNDMIADLKAKLDETESRCRELEGALRKAREVMAFRSWLTNFNEAVHEIDAVIGKPEIPGKLEKAVGRDARGGRAT